MTPHDTYQDDFFQVFAPLDRWGPGSQQATLLARNAIPFQPKQILDIGCGHGASTLPLLDHTQAEIIAVDTARVALDGLSARLNARPDGDRVTLLEANMAALDFPAGSFDLIWAEGSAYNMGVEAALTAWMPLLTQQGCLVFSDLVWLTKTRSAAAIEFWHSEYPDMQDLPTRLAQCRDAGYAILLHFVMDPSAWTNYSEPLKQRIETLTLSRPDSDALRDLARELALYDTHRDEFGYAMFVLQHVGKPDTRAQSTGVAT